MSTGKQFQKRVEDFTCENCGREVVGTGFTNHCPNCLYSKHVDINPGDREAACGGSMKPVSVEKRAGEWRITHRCCVCGHKKINSTSPNDSFDALVEIS